MALPALAAAALPILGQGFNAWMQWKGIKEGSKAQDKANRMTVDLFEKELSTNVSENAKDRRFRKQEQQASFGQRNVETFLERLSTMFNSKPQVADRLISLQRGRGK